MFKFKNRKEVIDNDVDGLIFENNDYIDLSSKIKKVINNPKKVSSLNRNAYKKVCNKFSWIEIGSSYKSIFKIMKIAFIGTRGIPASHGGFETMVEEISTRISKDYEVFVSSDCQSNFQKDFTKI